jgi:membrane protease YdiL (CAAX protease family)
LIVSKAEMVEKLQNAALLPIGVLAIVFAGAAVFYMARRYFPGDLKSGAMAELGWKPCSRKHIIIAVITGALITVYNLTVVIPLFPPDSHSFLGPVSTAAGSSGLNRWIWSFIAVCLAPPAEEFLFRGVLYSGFLRRWNATVSALVTSAMFVSMHLMEVWGYRPALIGISLLAGATIVARQRTGSLAAPLALHMSYNGVLIILAHLVLGGK